MGRFHKANIKKTLYYLKRNGLRDTYFAALERLHSVNVSYTFTELSDDEWKKQREWSRNNHNIKFSIIVPAFHTPENYFKEMIESVLTQSYENLELIIADADANLQNAKIVQAYQDERIKYHVLKENNGISENTNAALQFATGDYIGLLDHDDVLTKDALYEMAFQLVNSNASYELLYSDEDKCDSTCSNFYEQHKKPNFNLDLILSNNYICHFLVIKKELILKIGFRKEYDGAQDYDLILRCIQEIFKKKQSKESNDDLPVRDFPMIDEMIAHIPKVLYHWRCHDLSTAENPQSKQYAYEAGGRAIRDFLENNRVKAAVSSTQHLGFYRVKYEPDILTARTDIGAIGGIIFNEHNKITSGIIDENRGCPYKGLKRGYSGYMHRAVLQQEAYAVDIRLMKIRPELYEAIDFTIKNYIKKNHNKCDFMISGDRILIYSSDLSETQLIDLSIEICTNIRKNGYRIVYQPSWYMKNKN